MPLPWILVRRPQGALLTVAAAHPSVAAPDEEKHFVSHILAFFAASDGIVVENLGARFMSGERHHRLHALCQVR